MSTETPLEEVEQAQTVSKPVQAAYQTVEEQAEEAKQIAKESATAEKTHQIATTSAPVEESKVSETASTFKEGALPAKVSPSTLV